MANKLGPGKEEGTTNTPLDMIVLNKPDRFHLPCDVIDWGDDLGSKAAACLKQQMSDKLIEHQQNITEHGEDMPEIRDWR